MDSKHNEKQGDFSDISENEPPLKWQMALLITSVFYLLAALLLLIMGISLLSQESGEAMLGILPFSASIILLATFSGIIARHSWSYPLGRVISIISLFLFPIGTILGVLMFICLGKNRGAFQPISQASH